MTKPRLATLWLDGCSGCHMSLLDLDEALVTVTERADLVYSPLVDAREYPHGVDVALVEGAVGTEEDVEKIRLVRERTRILVALGDCAVTANVAGARNPVALKDIYDHVYVECADVGRSHPADPALPILLKHAVPLHDVVKVDLHVPGCPPSASTIQFVVGELLDGRMPDLRSRTRFG
jgi:NAD-reducing hydrogenase small subunit